jgi:hypothetical protein
MIHGEGVTPDVNIAPVVGAMALRALHRPMIAGPCVAGLAVGFTLMAEIHVLPGGGIVAVAALTGVVVCRSRVAGLAVG